MDTRNSQPMKLHPMSLDAAKDRPNQPVRPARPVPPSPQQGWGQDCPPEQGKRRRRRHRSFFGMTLMAIGLLAVLLVMARYVIIPVLVMLGGVA